MQPEVTPRIQWITECIVLKATELMIVVADQAFHGTERLKYITSDTGGIIERQLGVLRATTLEVEWIENGVKMRVSLYFHANNTHWWIYEIRTQDGSEAENWIYYSDNGPYLRTPVGETFRGDVVFESDALNTQKATLTLTGLQLSTVF